jgi:protein O-GlcNAc transferase
MVKRLSNLLGRKSRPLDEESVVANMLRLVPAARAAGEGAVQDLAKNLAEIGMECLESECPARAAQALSAADSLGYAAPYFLYNLALAYGRSGESAASVEAFRKAQTQGPRDAQADGYALRQLHALDHVTLSELRTAAEEWAALYAPDCEVRTSSGMHTPLRIGLVSGRFQRHAVGFLTLGVLEALDSARFSLLMFDNGKHEDDYTNRFKAIASAWIRISELDDDAAADAVRAQKIDVLIDLGGHSDGGRMGLFARRPAPVQVKWAGGQHGTTGLKAMDYFISDAVETPTGDDEYFVETVIRMPDSYACYTPPPDAPGVNSLPAATRGVVTFGSFNNIAKIGPRTVAAWARILQALPDSCLVLKHSALSEAETRNRLEADFAAYGIVPSRLALRTPTGHTAHLAAYHDIDIALDPFPWSGCVTTCESLWMGVPVLTLPGIAFCHRHSASFLRCAGLDEWIAADEDDYVEKAIGYANQLESVAALRVSLRDRVRRSPLCDAPRFARRFDDTLISIVQARLPAVPDAPSAHITPDE